MNFHPVSCRAKGHRISLERAFKMLVSDDDVGTRVHGEWTFMSGLVVGSTRDGIEWRVRMALEDAGGTNVIVLVGEELRGSYESHTKGRQGGEERAKACVSTLPPRGREAEACGPREALGSGEAA